MLGWGATSGFKEDWTWDQAAETYALDADMAAKLQKANPKVIPELSVHEASCCDEVKLGWEPSQRIPRKDWT